MAQVSGEEGSEEKKETSTMGLLVFFCRASSGCGMKYRRENAVQKSETKTDG